MTAMWWAIVTLGPVGYGDVVPIMPVGRMIAAVTICAGFIMIAMSIGIVATGFSREIHRRDFVVTWNMVARVPLFADLYAGEIADIMERLRSQTIESGATIGGRGEPAHSMYFIARPARSRSICRISDCVSASVISSVRSRRRAEPTVRPTCPLSDAPICSYSRRP
jgi:hypothetical protein